MRTPLTQQSWSGLTVLFRHSVGNHQGNKLTWKLAGSTHPQSCQLAESLWTDPWPIEWIGIHELISAFKKNSRWIVVHRVFPHNSCMPEQNHHHSFTTLDSYHICFMMVTTTVVFILCRWWRPQLHLVFVCWAGMITLKVASKVSLGFEVCPTCSTLAGGIDGGDAGNTIFLVACVLCVTAILCFTDA